MNTETARHLEELRDGLAAVRSALDRLEERLGALEAGLRSDSVRPGHRDAQPTSFQEPRGELGGEPSPSHPVPDESLEPSRPPAPPAAFIVGDRAGAEPDLAEFSLGMAEEVPELAPAPESGAPLEREPVPGVASSAPFDQDDLLRDLFAGTPSRPAASAPPTSSPDPFEVVSSRDVAPRSMPSDDELEAGLEAIHAPVDEEGMSLGGDRPPSREQEIPLDSAARAGTPREPRVDFSVDELEELLGPDRR